MKPWVGVAIVASVGALVSLGVARDVRRAEEDGVQRQVDEEATEASERIGFDLDVRIDALRLLARRWISTGGLDRPTWEDEAVQHLGAVAGFRSVEWADGTGMVQWAVSRADPSPRIGFDLSGTPDIKEGLVDSRASGTPDVVAPVALDSGAGILTLVPLPVAGGFDGWIVGAFGVDDLVTEAHGSVPNYRVAIRHHGGLVYDSDGAEITRFCASTPLSPVDPELTLEVCAHPELVAAARGPLPLLTLGVGLGATALASGLVVALGAARRRGAEAARLAADVQAHARALERANRELADLSYSVSHELRTPLRAINGHASILAEHASPGDLPALARIQANAQRMARQIDGLLELMRLVRAEARPRRVDLGAMARGHCEELLAREPDRRVELRIPDALWVQADPELAHVIVSALLDNAFKFTRNRTPAIVEVGPYPRGFYVRDNGAGFDMAYADKLFRTFETLHGPGEFEGLGLGLAIAARAAASHGGRIEADSRPGHGATFFVILGGTGPGARATSTDRSEIEPPAGEASRASERSSAGQHAPVDVSGRAPAGSATR